MFTLAGLNHVRIAQSNILVYLSVYTRTYLLVRSLYDILGNSLFHYNNQDGVGDVPYLEKNENITTHGGKQPTLPSRLT
jgi:hypothetical protein